jgi:tRNA pseudouridine38-40 synthase
MARHLASPRRIKLVLEYCGTRYHGWQYQPNVLTVQGMVERCLSRITNAPVRTHASGRTDAGVHALGQVVHFDTTSTIPLPALTRGLNSLLPDDIAVRHGEEVPDDFHARYSAQEKTYAYIVYNQPQRSVFQARYSWHVTQLLDVPAMRLASQALLGEHDFSAFRGAGCTARSPVRCLRRIGIKRRGERIFFLVSGNGFLRHMVRNIVGTLIPIGRGQIAPEAMAAIVQSRQRRCAGPTAAPQGLFLVRVLYGDAGAME